MLQFLENLRPRNRVLLIQKVLKKKILNLKKRNFGKTWQQFYLRENFEFGML